MSHNASVFFLVVGTILLLRFQKMGCTFCGRRSILETSQIAVLAASELAPTNHATMRGKGPVGKRTFPSKGTSGSDEPDELMSIRGLGRKGLRKSSKRKVLSNTGHQPSGHGELSFSGASLLT